MNQGLRQSPQERQQNKNTQELYEQAKAIEPKPIGATVPEKQRADAQKAAFLAGDIENPSHIYPVLKDYSKDKIKAIEDLGRILVDSVDSPLLKKVYQDQIEGYALMGNMMLAMDAVKSADNEEEYKLSAERFMQFNIEKYGKPDRQTYESLLTDRVRDVLSKDLGESGQVFKRELLDMLPSAIRKNVEEGGSVERFSPSLETVQWMGDMVEMLYGDMLKHVPDQEEFTPDELAEVFRTIIDIEFGDAARGWRVEVAAANAINVNASEKLIQIPVDRGMLSRDRVRALVVHEIGVHMFRSVAGASTDIGPLATGLAGYYDAEEGLGVVMEQALEGKFREAGADHYISAGLAFYDDADFRQMFEVKWRMKALEGVKEGGDLTDETINKARDFAYKNVTRSLRGTDSLPWFKDLSYYNGSVEIWKYLESIIYDEFQLSLLMQGKVSTSKEHQRVILESRSI